MLFFVLCKYICIQWSCDANSSQFILSMKILLLDLPPEGTLWLCWLLAVPQWDVAHQQKHFTDFSRFEFLSYFSKTNTSLNQNTEKVVVASHLWYKLLKIKAYKNKHPSYLGFGSIKISFYHHWTIQKN